MSGMTLGQAAYEARIIARRTRLLCAGELRDRVDLVAGKRIRFLEPPRSETGEQGKAGRS